MNLKALLAAVAGAVILTSGVHVQAQSTRAGSVRVVVMDDYPAFGRQGNPSTARRSELRAVVVRSSATDPNSSVILLNPAHLNAATLHDALEALRVCPTGSSARANFVSISAAGPARAVPAAQSARLNASIAALRSAPRSRVAGLDGSGRALTISDAEVCR